MIALSPLSPHSITATTFSRMTLGIMALSNMTLGVTNISAMQQENYSLSTNDNMYFTQWNIIFLDTFEVCTIKLFTAITVAVS
jgi:hypothetical protein